MIIKKLKTRIKRFLHDTRGVAAIEAIVLLPSLMMVCVSGVVFFEGYRLQNDSLRATYAVADAIAREKEAIDDAYLNSMHDMLDHMIPDDGGVSMRVTIACFSEKRNKYRVAWSRVQGNYMNLSRHKHHTLHGEADKLPEMPYGDQVIVVETFVRHDPSLSVGIPAQDAANFVVARPRFTNQVKFKDKPKWVCKGG